MTPLETYLQAFASLNRAPGAYDAATLKKAPHKPLLLLALLELFERKHLTDPFVNTGENLAEMDGLFASAWAKVCPDRPVESIAIPFSQMANEPKGYWKLVPYIGYTLDASNMSSMADLKVLKKHCEGADLAKNLFEILWDANVRHVLRETLLTSHFSPEAAEKLRSKP